MRMRATAGDGEGEMEAAQTLEDWARPRVTVNHRQLLGRAGRQSGLYLREERCVQNGLGSQMEAGSQRGTR